MAGVKIGSYGHFIAILGVSKNLVTFADPLSGRKTLPLSEFLTHFEFTGFHLFVSEIDSQRPLLTLSPQKQTSPSPL